jgi:hypothetical protein
LPGLKLIQSLSRFFFGADIGSSGIDSRVVWRLPHHNPRIVLVLRTLADFVNDHGECWPSISLISRNSKVKPRCLRYLLKQLRADGVLTIHRGGGAGRSNRYRFNIERMQELVAKKDASVQSKPAENLQPYSPKVQDSAESLQSRAENSALQDDRTSNRTFSGELAPATDKVWDQVFAKLISRINPHTLDSFLRPAKQLSFDGRVLVLRVPNTCFLHIPERFGAEIRAALASLGFSPDIQILVAPEGR